MARGKELYIDPATNTWLGEESTLREQTEEEKDNIDRLISGKADPLFNQTFHEQRVGQLSKTVTRRIVNNFLQSLDLPTRPVKRQILGYSSTESDDRIQS